MNDYVIVPLRRSLFLNRKSINGHTKYIKPLWNRMNEIIVKFQWVVSLNMTMMHSEYFNYIDIFTCPCFSHHSLNSLLHTMIEETVKWYKMLKKKFFLKLGKYYIITR